MYTLELRGNHQVGVVNFMNADQEKFSQVFPIYKEKILNSKLADEVDKINDTTIVYFSTDSVIPKLLELYLQELDKLS